MKERASAPQGEPGATLDSGHQWIISGAGETAWQQLLVQV